MAKKKLFNVQITIDTVILAETAGEAEGLALDALKDGDITDDAGAHAIDLSYLPAPWELGSIPYGLRDLDRTVGEWVKLGAAPKFEEACTARLQTMVELAAQMEPSPAGSEKKR